MAVAIVEVLEAVDVDEEHAQSLVVGHGPVEVPGQALVEVAAVGDAGQGIGHCSLEEPDKEAFSGAVFDVETEEHIADLEHVPRIHQHGTVVDRDAVEEGAVLAVEIEHVGATVGADADLGMSPRDTVTDDLKVSVVAPADGRPAGLQRKGPSCIRSSEHHEHAANI